MDKQPVHVNMRKLNQNMQQVILQFFTCRYMLQSTENTYRQQTLCFTRDVKI